MAKKQKPKTLPDKPSELIRVAIADLKAIEKSKKYSVNMETWHRPVDDKKHCQVCLAGAVMAKTLKLNATEDINPEFDIEDGYTADRLCALNSFRTGDVSEGLSVMDAGDTVADHWSFDRSIIDYHDDPALFKREMLELADDLKASGL